MGLGVIIPSIYGINVYGTGSVNISKTRHEIFMDIQYRYFYSVTTPQTSAIDRTMCVVSNGCCCGLLSLRLLAGHVASRRPAHFRSAVAARRRRLSRRPGPSRVIIALTSPPHVLMTSRGGHLVGRCRRRTARRDPPVTAAARPARPGPARTGRRRSVGRPPPADGD